MSIPVRTYADLLDRIEALAGKDSFTTNEQTRLLSLVNARLYSAYRRCDYWPRYLTVGESRVMTDGIIPFTQGSAVVVSGAGTTDADGTYQPVGTFGGKAIYYLNGDTESYSIVWGTFWTLISPDATDLYQDDGGTDPWDGTWSLLDGESPAPTFTESTRANIDTFLRVYTGTVYGAQQTGAELDFYVDSDGAHMTNAVSDYNLLYVGYKAIWDGPYAANSTAIPYEWFEYAAHGAFADWLRSTGNFAQAGSEDAVAESLLNSELMRAQVRYNSQIYATRYSTYVSRQSRNF